MDCLFCKMIDGSIPTKKIYEDDYVIAILDLHPSANCHTLVIPKKHYTDLLEIDNETINHINNAAKKIIPVIMEKTNAKALSTRVNYGETQEIKHYHLHLLPDYGLKKCTMTQNDAWELLKDSNIN